MKNNKKLYQNIEWFSFAERIKTRDNFKCLKCGRNTAETILQVHHINYILGKKPWQYPLSDCITLCKGCHAIEHGHIEPNKGWVLISIEDLGDLIGVCERKNCNTSIRYEHLTYHPKFGYKILGSTCIEYLTQEDKFISKEVLKHINKIGEFVKTSKWDNGFTRKDKKYIFTIFSHNQIRIYMNENNYSFQIALKKKGVRWFDYKKVIQVKNKNLYQVKELAFIVLKGLISEKKEEIEILRGLYKRMI